MNEIEVIREQLSAERQHASAVANACATAFGRPSAVASSSGSSLAEFRQACVEYLVCVLAWFEERDQRLTDLWLARLTAADEARRTLEGALASRGRSREALEKLEGALACPASASDSRVQESWRAFAQFFNSGWSVRRDAIDAWLAANHRATDWRVIAGIDADSILEERRRYARVARTLPAGASLAFPRPRGS